jgi:hypothetical protein
LTISSMRGRICDHWDMTLSSLLGGVYVLVFKLLMSSLALSL